LNTLAKGRKNEKRCADIFREKGWHVWATFRSKWQNLDMFGLFDVVVLHPDGLKMLFIQVKSNRCDKKTKDAIKAIELPPRCEKWVYIWVDRKGWMMEEM